MFLKGNFRYIDKPAGTELLRRYDLSKGGRKDVSVDTLNMPEGVYPVKAVLKYIDMTNNSAKELTATGTLIVDHVLPVAQITYPNKSLALCPVRVTDPKNDWYGIPVEGIATDNSQAGKYEVYYGVGEQPSYWMPAKTQKLGVGFPIKGNLPVQGQLGVWDVTDLTGTSFSLKEKVTDAAGNVSCHTTNFTIDALTQIADLSTDKYLFSPNGDGVLDNVETYYRIEEYATVDAKVFPLIEEADGTYALGSAPVRTIVSGLKHIGGTEHIAWDGKNDSGAAVADGLYGVAVFATDSCGNTNVEWIDVEVDNTPPDTLVTYPRPPDALGAIVEVTGTADDLNFASYILEIGQGENPDVWTIISSNTYPVEDNILGIWNTAGFEGIWTLKLTAKDDAGNENTVTVILNLAARENLINGLSITPRFFSPNNDGNIDTASIAYSLTATCLVSIGIQNAGGTIIKTFTDITASAGTYTLTWDGKDNSGSTSGDGVYTVKLSAALSLNHSIAQEEAVTVVVDSTPPAIHISQPLSNAYLADSFAVKGAIRDANLTEYTISYSGGTGTVILDKANQNREDYIFGILNELPEGNYVLNTVAGDQGQNRSETKIPFTVDSTPPKVVITTPADSEFYGSTRNIINITGSIVEANLATYSLRYGPGDNPSQLTDLMIGNLLPESEQIFSWNAGNGSGIPDGLYTLSLSASDKAGLSGEAKVKVTIDNTPPEAAITNPKDGDYIKASFEIRGTASDISLDKYTIELSQGNCGSAFKWAALKTSTSSVKDSVLAQLQMLPSDGDYCIRLTALDKLGNKSEAKVNIKIDTHPPAPPVLSGNVENKTSIKLNWTQNTEPDIAGYDIYRNGQKINAALIKEPLYVDPNPSTGSYAYTVKAIDFAVNESTPSNEIKLRIDTAGPDARISLPADGSRVNGLVDIKGTAYSSDDFRQYRVSVAEGSNPSAWNLIRTSPVPMPYGTLTQWDTLGLRGSYSIKLEAEDISGNVSSHQITVTLDDIAPAAPVITSAADSGSNVTITWKANTDADLAGYLLFRSDRLANAASGAGLGDWNAYLLLCTAYIDKSVPDGTYTYYVVAVDRAGNTSNQSNSVEISIDTHSPRATIIEPMNNSEFSNALPIKAESPDLDVAFVQFQYKKTMDGTWENLGNAVIKAPYYVSFDPLVAALTYGDYNLRAVATDKGGNTDSAPPAITVTYTDLMAPSAPFDLHALTNGGIVTLTWTANVEGDLGGYNIYRTAGSAKEKINAAIVGQAAYQDQSLPDGVLTYEVTAVDTFENESAPSNSASANIYTPLVEQPYTPVDKNVIEINGSNVAAPALVEIFDEITSGSLLAGTVNADAQGNFAFTNMELSLGENKITAKGKDTAGNISKPSQMAIVVYDEAPSSPTGLEVTVQDYNVSLTWEPNTEPDLSGYNIYKNEQKINAPVAVTEGTLTASSTYSSNYPSNAFDSNSSSYWMSNYNSGGFIPTWLQIELPSKELINHFEINWYSASNAGKDYEIQVWSGYAWIKLTRVTGNAVKDNIFDFKPSYRTDKIRIYITDTTDTDSYRQVGISEIKILKDNLVIQTSYNDSAPDDAEYTYTVTAVDYLGFESGPSEAVKAVVGDVIPPAAPSNLTATQAGSNIILNWSINQEPDLAGYNIYRNSEQGWIKINSALITANSFTDENLRNGSYTYRITAMDQTGNESLPSNEAFAVVNILPLQPPVNLVITPSPEGSVLNISWTHNAPDQVKGYNIYRSAASGGPYTKINSSLITDTQYIDGGLVNGIAYYYVVTALDSFGNESAYSNEAMGIPSDSAQPPAPSLLFPTVPERPVLLYQERTDIAGVSEPAARIELFKDGKSIAETTALGKDEIQSFPLDSGVSQSALSPDGNTMAYKYNGAIWINKLATGERNQIIPQGDSPLWSPDGNKLSYGFTDSSGYSRIGIYDINTLETKQLTNDTNVSEGKPSWSSDGTKIALIRYKQGAWNAWVKDLGTGALNQATTDGNITNTKISPDGKKLAYLRSQILSIADLTSGAVDQIDAQAHQSAPDWSPDSRSIVFASSRSGSYNIFIFNAITKELSQITETTVGNYYPAWSPDGGHIAFSRYANYKYSLWIVSVQESEQERVLQQNLSSMNYLTWIRSGGIAFTDQSTMNVGYLQGYFSFKDIQLEQGENIFAAAATDSTGNKSLPSKEISVILDTEYMPDLEITANDIFVYPPYPVEGEEVLVNAYVRNKGQSEIQDVEVDVYLMEPSGNVELLTSERIPSITAGSEEVIVFEWDSTGKKGENRIIGVIDPDDEIAEFDEANNIAFKDFVVVESEGLSMSTTLNSDTYQINQDVNISVTLTNSGIEKEVTVTTSIEDDGGNVVESLNPVQAHLPYATRKDIALTWNTGLTLAGKYRVHTLLMDSNGVLSENIAPFAILPEISINASITTDKAEYIPGENVLLTVRIENNGRNYIIPELRVTVRIIDANSAILFAEEKLINNVLPGGTVAASSSWNTSTNPHGVYSLTLEVRDAEGNVLSTSATNITISNDIKPSALLKGQISVDKQSVLQGEPVNISYSVTNVGNIDVPQVDLSILSVHVVELTAYDTLTDRTSLIMNQSYANTKPLSTNTYSAKDYLVILRASISGTEETLASTYFRVEGAPSAPSLYSPQHGVDVETSTPTLWVNNASDPNDDKLTYEFELYSDSSLATLAASSGMIPEEENITSWFVPVNLLENRTYYWRARAYDGLLYGDWMLPAAFRVNTYNDPPSAPTLSSPADTSEVDNLMPLLVVNNASDPDSLNLTYNFELALDPDFLNITIYEIGIFVGDGITTWKVPLELMDNTLYYWRAQADDWFIEGPWMTPARFFVNTENDAPGAPVIVSPVEGSEIMTLSADIVASNSADPDHDILNYLFELDTVNTFDSSDLIQSGSIPEGEGTTSWHIEGLQDNTFYYIRTKASDGFAESIWSEVADFFVNTQNDPPTTPVLSNPSDGSGVKVSNPTLSVHNSSDMDRDVLTYEFEVYDETKTALITSLTGIEEIADITSWTVPVNLTENQTYYWRARAYDGVLYSDWMTLSSFMINAANDAPYQPRLYSPADGSSIDTIYPTLSIENAEDPDSDTLRYNFDIYINGQLIQSITGIPQCISGITSITLTTGLTDNTTYNWRARAYDGDRFGAWMDMAGFSVHLPVNNITATINFDPDTLNQKSAGKWVTVYIELPSGYNVNDINIASVYLNGTVKAESWPYAIGDVDKDGIPDLMVKFRRDNVIAILPDGNNIMVKLTGTVGTTTFEGIDLISVIH